MYYFAISEMRYAAWASGGGSKSDRGMKQMGTTVVWTASTRNLGARSLNIVMHHASSDSRGI